MNSYVPGLVPGSGYRLPETQKPPKRIESLGRALDGDLVLAAPHLQYFGWLVQ